MRDLYLPTRQIYSYVLTGKFKAPSPEWKHEYFFLGEYELFVMTEGTLYLTYNNESFSLNPNEYLILPPCNAYRQGYKPSYCSFYWLHFSTLQGFIPTSSDYDLSTLKIPYDSYFTLPQQGSVPKPEKLVVLMKQLQDLVKK